MGDRLGGSLRGSEAVEAWRAGTEEATETACAEDGVGVGAATAGHRRDEPDVKWWQRAASASTGSVLSAIFMTPFDVVKVRLQSAQSQHVFGRGVDLPTEAELRAGQGGVRGGGEAGKPVLPSWTTRTMFRHVVRTEGVAGLWKGVTPALLMAVPSSTTYMVVYDEMRLAMVAAARRVSGTTDPGAALSALEMATPLVAGGLARMTVVMLVAPFELVRTQMQSEGRFSRTLRQALRGEVRDAGLQSLWRGAIPAMWRDVPYSAIYWFGYEQFRVMFVRKAAERRRRILLAEWQADAALRATQPNPCATPLHQVPLTFHDSFLSAFLSGASSAAIAGTLSTPFDVAKTRRQSYRASNAPTDAPRTTFGILADIVRNEGLPGLFRGLTPRLLRVAPASAIMISSYDLGKRFFQAQADRQTPHRTQ
jgi:solute carrier family 25 protein 39/40